MTDRFAAVQRIADAVLYEGYLLYPYRATSSKNRVRFQFGVVAPEAHVARDASEVWAQQTELLIEPPGEAAADPRITARVRFLQLQGRAVEAADPTAASGFRSVDMLTVGDDDLIPWEEATEAYVDITDLALTDLIEAGAAGRVVPLAIGGGRDVEHVHGPDGDIVGRIVRTRWPIDGSVIVSALPADGGFVRLRVRVENRSEDDPAAPAANRDEALRRSLLGCHTLLAIDGGAFVSLTDPPPEALAAAATCVNIKTWPVLAGDEGATDLVLSSPIILADHPAVAPESPQNLFDGAEIDEILTLRIMTLSDDEKRAARATDPRARAIIDAADDLPPELLDKLHGAIRYLRGGPGGTVIGGPNDGAARDEPGLPAAATAMDSWATVAPDFPTFSTPTDDAVADPLAGPMPSSVWEPEARVAPERMAIEVAGATITKGSSVRLRPNRRADSMDTFLTGRLATVEAIFESVDDEVFVAITVDDDPATELHREFGRYFYFSPDELEPVAAAAGSDGAGAIR